jgi:hypothetical protein
MNSEPADEAAEGTAYSFRPSMLGAPREFRLASNGLYWVVARRSGHIRFNDIRRLRLTYRPTSMQSHRFMTELWAQGAPKLEILSSSWKSMIEQQRLDRPYTAFITELHRRIALAAPPARFERGSNPLLYWSGLIVFTGLTLALALLAVRALQSDTKAGAAFVGVFLLLLLWQGGNFFRRNKPGVYRAEAPPVELMPKG